MVMIERQSYVVYHMYDVVIKILILIEWLYLVLYMA